jgi:hypothetical protein
MKAFSNTPEPDERREIQARSLFSDLASLLKTFILRDVTPDELAARDVDSFLAKVFDSRDVDHEQAMQARSLFGNFASFLENLILRDITADELVARDASVDSFLIKVLNSRGFDPEQAMQARSLFGNFAILSDVTPDELAAREANVDSFLAKVLNSRDFDPEQAMQARDVTPGELARDYDMDQFVKDYRLSLAIP